LADLEAKHAEKNQNIGRYPLESESAITESLFIKHLQKMQEIVAEHLGSDTAFQKMAANVIHNNTYNA
jgi:hypothetical protein